MPAARYISSRLLLAFSTLLVVSAVTFLATNVVPTDPARLALGRNATPEQLDVFRRQQGLDKPVLERYASWLGNVAKGDWGTSTLNRREVAGEVRPRMARTIILGGIAMLVAIPLAFLIGVYTGKRSGTRADVGISIGSLLINSFPEFVVGICLLVIFGVQLQVLPIESSDVVFGDTGAMIKAYVLPTLTLTLVLMPYMIRMVRANVRDVLGQPYIRSAVLRGVSSRRITWRHIVPNAAIPVISVIALTLAELVGGVVVVETLFGFPGVGKLLVDSVLAKDTPTVQAVTLVIAAGFIFLNLTADTIMLGLDPRLRAAR